MTEKEQLFLINFVCRNYFRFIEHRPNFMECTLYEDNPEVPPLIWEIRNRIIKREGIQEYENSYSEEFFLKFHGTLKGVTRDKLFILTHGKENGGLLSIHTDINQPCRIHSRFNVFVSIPENDSKTHYDGHIVECKERGYVLCRSGIDWHYTDIIRSVHKSRIVISYGFQLPEEVLARIYKIPKIKWNIENTYFYIYKQLEKILGYTDTSLFNCSNTEFSSIPTAGMLKSDSRYKTRGRGLPPFNTSPIKSIWNK